MKEVTVLRQTTGTILMVRPASFGYNPETAGSNAFQKDISTADSGSQSELAKAEFDLFARELIKAGIEIIVVDDTKDPPKPDAVFPNNWFSTHILDDGRGLIFIYPMMSELRRKEVRYDVVNMLAEKYSYGIEDLSKSAGVIEGTGSIVFDHVNKRAFAALSPRTQESLLNEVCGKIGYEPVLFTAVDKGLQEVYHTNVVLTIGETFAVICTEMIKDASEREQVTELLSAGGREVIGITEEQVNSFAGNMLQLNDKDGVKVLVISEKAYRCLDEMQKQRLAVHNPKLVLAQISTIETIGGGSARCMIAEIFHN
ncbi:MAG: amidinotransferase [Ignavibacteria bacterium]|nr:amidinotransferase [Ignavibacteria bacterium]